MPPDLTPTLENQYSLQKLTRRQVLKAMCGVSITSIIAACTTDSPPPAPTVPTEPTPLKPEATPITNPVEKFRFRDFNISYQLISLAQESPKTFEGSPIIPGSGQVGKYIIEDPRLPAFTFSLYVDLQHPDEFSNLFSSDGYQKFRSEEFAEMITAPCAAVQRETQKLAGTYPVDIFFAPFENNFLGDSIPIESPDSASTNIARMGFRLNSSRLLNVPLHEFNLDSCSHAIVHELLHTRLERYHLSNAMDESATEAAALLILPAVLQSAIPEHNSGQSAFRVWQRRAQEFFPNFIDPTPTESLTLNPNLHEIKTLNTGPFRLNYSAAFVDALMLEKAGISNQPGPNGIDALYDNLLELNPPVLNLNTRQDILFPHYIEAIKRTGLSPDILSENYAETLHLALKGLLVDSTEFPPLFKQIVFLYRNALQDPKHIDEITIHIDQLNDPLHLQPGQILIREIFSPPNEQYTFTLINSKEDGTVPIPKLHTDGYLLSPNGKLYELSQPITISSSSDARLGRLLVFSSPFVGEYRNNAGGMLMVSSNN